ncbi:MAG: class I SAM-dependent methyltransferase [Candidatus Bathyarchaeota archaeon]|nr:class I SAM-dependent methyltransferase [Candidatus Bathyarchaeota archaeon]
MSVSKVKITSIRHNFVYAVAKMVAPKLYEEIKMCSDDFINRNPRPFTLFLKEHFGNKVLVGCEIGFGYGKNAKSLLECLNIGRLYCVDPYIGKLNTHVNELNLYSALKNNNKISFLGVTSDEAAKLLPNNLDFVYVDGVHTFEQCFRDLENYYPLLNNGGLIGGHDFTMKFETEVVKAVLNFSVKKGKAPKVIMPDFWFEK